MRFLRQGMVRYYVARDRNSYAITTGDKNSQVIRETSAAMSDNYTLHN